MLQKQLAIMAVKRCVRLIMHADDADFVAGHLAERGDRKEDSIAVFGKAGRFHHPESVPRSCDVENGDTLVLELPGCEQRRVDPKGWINIQTRAVAPNAGCFVFPNSGKNHE